jgi:hypothetical protein
MLLEEVWEEDLVDGCPERGAPDGKNEPHKSTPDEKK